MARNQLAWLLTVNTGSSSLKASLYPLHAPALERAELTAAVTAIGSATADLRVTDSRGSALEEPRHDTLPDHRAAMYALLSWLDEHGYGAQVAAVGHRVVHGGAAHRAPELVTPALVAALRDLTPIDPDHMPQVRGAIEASGQAFPGIPQVACFDTAFHRTMPWVAQIYALPRQFTDAGLLRYGFHGLSYESIVEQLRALDATAAAGRLVIAHLGNGASMAAVLGGVSVDTTMGFTPAGGLVMSTRAGDLDPGVIAYLLQTGRVRADDVSALVNRRSGLLAVAGGSTGDMRELLAREPFDRAAAEAIALFCYQARKFLAALTATLGGLETLVFTGGIGEHAAPIRERICEGLQYLGIQLDAARNAAHAPIISADGSSATVRVMKTDEDRIIAEHTLSVLREQGGFGVSL
jgi:acetate kinase